MKKPIQIGVLFAFSVLFIFANTFPALADDKNAAEVNKYIEMLGSPSSETRVEAARLVSRSRLTDPELYNIINEKLLNEYTINKSNRGHIEEMSWMCKALSASGSAAYLPTLEEISNKAASSKLKKYAKQSISMLMESAERHKVSEHSIGDDPDLSPEVNRYIRMIRSQSSTLKKDAAKSICATRFTERKLFDALRDELLKGYPFTSSNDRMYTDALGWILKALASSGMAEYRPVLEEILEKSSSFKLQRHAKNEIRKLQ